MRVQHLDRPEPSRLRALAALLGLLAGLFGGVIAQIAAAHVAGAADQSVFAYGDAPFHGSTGTVGLDQPIVGFASLPDGSGYWLVGRDGRVATFGAAVAHGSVRGASNVVGMAATSSGRGYWIATADGAVHTFGDATFHGSLGATRLAQPIVGITTAAGRSGYWLVARDGGIFSFGAARFHGSTGAVRLNQPIVGMAGTPSGEGYWLVARDGGIFSFGDARFHGSTGAVRLQRSVVAMAATPSGGGYVLLAGDGGLFTFGDAVFHGSLGDARLDQPAVALATTRAGYWLVTSGALAPANRPRAAEIRLGEGSFRVGDGGIPAGDYRTQTARAGCHWERTVGLTGDPTKVLSSATADGPQIVTLKPGDVFRTLGCAEWSNDVFPLLRAGVLAVGDGTWLVGQELAAGLWTAPGGPDCQWSIVTDFSGELGSIRATDNGATNPLVAVLAGDRGFVSTGCGTWTKR